MNDPLSRRSIVQCTIRLSAIAAAAAVLAACAQLPSVELPDLTQKAPEGLSADEQKRAVDDLTQRKSTHATEAAREIERARQR